MDAWDISLVLLVLTLVPSSHQWTSHGSIQFLSEGESTSLEAPGVGGGLNDPQLPKT